MTTAITTMPFDQMKELADSGVKSNFFGGIKTREQALILMAVADAEGRPPVSAFMSYHVINGKPSITSQAALARFQAAGGKVKYLTRTDDCVEMEFSHPQGGTLVIDWTFERAKKAGITGKDTWRQYSRQMLTARCIGEGVRAILPGCISGMLLPEEAADVAPDVPSSGPELDVTPAKPVTGLTALQARVAELKPHPAEPVDATPSKVTLAVVLEAIQQSADDDELNNAGALANALSDGDKALARKAWRERAKELSAPPTAEATA
jgi:hypothetical protein